MKRILVISFSPLHRDPRVYRQLKLLCNRYSLTAVGLTDPCLDGVEWWPILAKKKSLLEKLVSVFLLKSHMYRRYYASTSEVLCLNAEWSYRECPKFDLVIANDIDALPVAIDIASNAPVFYDAHEYAPKEWDNRLWKFYFSRYRHWQCKTYLTQAACMSTVCQGLADSYSQEYGVSPFLTYNTPTFRELQPSHIQKQKIRLVHHGGAHWERGIGELVGMMEFLDERFTLDFFLVAGSPNTKSYVNELKEQAVQYGDRICFNDPAPMQKLPEVINKYDIGVYLLPPSSFNNSMALPNKFFEFVQGRLAIATGPSPEMAKLTRQWEMGVISENFSAESLAHKLNALSPEDIWRMKQNTHRAAHELCYEVSAKEFMDHVTGLLSN